MCVHMKRDGVDRTSARDNVGGRHRSGKAMCMSGRKLLMQRKLINKTENARSNQILCEKIIYTATLMYYII